MQLLSSIADLKDIVNKEYIDSILADYVLSANLGALATKDSLAFSDLTSRPSKLSDFTDDVVAGKYLPLSGGTVTGTIEFTASTPALKFYRDYGNVPYIHFGASPTSGYGEVGADKNGNLVFWSLVSGNSAYNAWNTVLHAKNIGEYALKKVANVTSLNTNAGEFFYSGFRPEHIPYGNYVGGITLQTFRDAENDYRTQLAFSTDAKGFVRSYTNGSWSYWKTIAFTDSTVDKAKSVVDASGNALTLLHSGNYSNYALPITGGTITGNGAHLLAVNRQDGNPVIEFRNNGSLMGRYGFTTDGTPISVVMGSQVTLIHSGNIGSQIVEGITTHTGDATNANGDIAKLNSYYSSKGFRISRFNGLNGLGTANSDGLIVNWPLDHSYGQQWYMDDESHTIQVRYVANAVWSDWKTIAFTDSNVASATKLATARTLWGQSFDGTADVAAQLTFNANDAALSAWKKDGSSTSIFLQVNPDRHLLVGQGTARENGGLYLYGNDIRMCYGNAGSSSNTAMLINASGNVTIGSSDTAGADYKLRVDGTSRFTDRVSVTSLRIVPVNGSYAADFTIEGSSLTLNRELKFTNVTASDICSGIAAAFKTSLAQTENLIARNIILGASSGSASNLALSFQKYTSVSNTAPNGLTTLMTLTTDGNLGIGTTNPQYKLDVGGNSRVKSTRVGINTAQISDSAIFEIAGSKDDALFIGQQSNNDMWLQAAYKGNSKYPSQNHTYNLLLQPLGGNVFIGTTEDKGAKLQVAGYIVSESITHRASIADNSISYYNKTNGGFFLYGGIREGEALSIEIAGNTGSWVGNGITLKQNGYVGIGTTSPAYKLDVAGTARISGATTLSSTLSVSGLVTASSGIKIGSILLTDENGTLKIAGNAYTTGQLGAGEAGQPTSGGGSGQYWSNEYDMDIGTDVLVSSKEYIGTNTIVGWDLAGSCLNDLYIGYDGYTIWMQGSVDEASDMRLKTVIDAVNLDIRDIAYAPIFNYVFKSRPQGRQMLGSSAQYWQAIAPKAVSENDKGNLAMNYGAIALASVVAVAKKTLTHEEEIANLKLEVQDLKQRLEKYELN